MTKPRSRLIESLFAEQRVLSISEITERVKDTLESEFADIHIQGEISNYKKYTSGHWYFTLKDESSQLRGVFFRQWNRLLRFEPENGLEVRVRGRLSVYAERGDYQILVETMEPVGVGALQLAFEQQVRRLSAEGLFDEARKRKLPLLPRRIGIVTSPVGAVIQDMLRILERRAPGVDIVIAPVRVQGSTAAGEIADAIRLLNKHARKKDCEIDVIIVGRGGGAMEDLWAFNEEQVVRAIHDSEIPVVSAVGHETDYTIADFVADLRAPTPSAAAELIAAETSDLMNKVSDLESAIIRAMNLFLLQKRVYLRDLTESRGFAEVIGEVSALSQRWRELQLRAAEALRENLRQARLRVISAQHRLTATDFRSLLRVARTQLQSCEYRLTQGMQRQLERGRHQLAVQSGNLDLLSPMAVLGRGYVLVKDETGKLVTRAESVHVRQKLHLRFEDGEIHCVVTEN
jgi:exodeoxyribonuclease VII large subunit